jgi:steroid delta-isomerase-like uncharacterized protein
MTSQEQANKEIVLQMYEEVWNRKNLDFVNEAVSPDFKDHPPKRFFEVPIRGREALYEAAVGFHAGIPDFHDRMIEIVAEGDRVVYLGEITGTHTGTLFGVPASGKSVKILGINYFRLEDGKVVERWGIFDVMGMMQQIGMIPSPSANGH